MFVATIFSDPVYDGDIQRAPDTGVFTVNQGNTQSVLAGIDPTSGVEFRSLLAFHLTGAGGVPGNAIIKSAFIDIFLNNITPQPLIGTIPLRIELVYFQPPNLIGSDFDRHVSIDVTPLMEEAQRQGGLDFQLRIMEDLGIVTPGLIEINDTTGTNRAVLAPALEVTYF